MTQAPDFQFEQLAMAGGATFVAGVDEVGRGPLAGPVSAAAVILDPDHIPAGLNDSKKLTARRRAVLAEEIHKTARVAIVHLDVDVIDRMNILRASQEAMRLALLQLSPAPDFALIDGKLLPPDLPCAARPIIKGDALSVSISAASIVAKISRDQLMVDLAQQHPGYGWERNAGYGTKEHLSALRNLGVTPQHRRSFAPVRNML